MKLALYKAHQSLERYERFGVSEAMVFFTLDLLDFIEEISRAGAPNQIIGELGTYYSAYWDASEQERPAIANDLFDKLPAILETLEGQSK